MLPHRTPNSWRQGIQKRGRKKTTPHHIDWTSFRTLNGWPKDIHFLTHLQNMADFSNIVQWISLFQFDVISVRRPNPWSRWRSQDILVLVNLFCWVTPKHYNAILASKFSGLPFFFHAHNSYKSTVYTTGLCTFLLTTKNRKGFKENWHHLAL